jgi:geranylgeranyl diphosphate synthase type I
MRHGRPTVWKIWGQANAINAGDALFTLAFEALSLLSNRGLASDTLIEVWRIFNQTALQLTRGQYLDMRYEHQENVSVDEYISMISGKSAALLAGSAQIGALVASNDADVARLYSRFGLNLGIAFQIRDDILGIWGEPTVTGKSAATDIISRKKSLPVLYSLSKSTQLAAIYRDEYFDDSRVNEAVAILNEVGAQDYAQEREAHYYHIAVETLQQANPRGEEGEWLRQLVNTLFQREY